jgi:hypothetical protein
MHHYHLLADFWIAEHRRELEGQAASGRRGREAARALRVRVEQGRSRGAAPAAPVVVRRGRIEDHAELGRLARGCVSQPSTAFVVAERSGALVVAVGLVDGRVLVDEGRAGADVIALVRLCAEQLRRRHSTPRAA